MNIFDWLSFLFMSLVFNCLFWFVYVCACVHVCSMEWIKRFSVFTSLKDDRLRDQFPFLDIDGVLFLLHRINTSPGAQPSLLSSG